MYTSARARALLIALLALCVFFSYVSITHAEADLSSTIRAAVLSDPRASSMTPEQLDSVVAALTFQAQAQGMTAHDIAWRPQVAGESAWTTGTVNMCGSMPGFLCAMNQMFGVDGANVFLPMLLFLGLATLLLITALMIEHAKGRPPKFR